MIFDRISGAVGFVFTNVYVAYIKLILKGGIFRSCNFHEKLCKQPCYGCLFVAKMYFYIQ